MARQFDVTREFNSTIITATVTTANMETLTFVTEDISLEVPGNLDADKAYDALAKVYKGAKIEHVVPMYINGMLGWHLSDIMQFAEDINPISRNAWQDGITEEQKEMVRAQARENKKEKAAKAKAAKEGK